MLQPSSAADKANCLDKWNTLASSWISHGPEKLPEYLGEVGSFSTAWHIAMSPGCFLSQ